MSRHPISFFLEHRRIVRADTCDAPDGGPALALHFTDGSYLLIYADPKEPLRLAVDMVMPTSREVPP